MNNAIQNIDLTPYTPEQRATMEEALQVMADTLHWDHDIIERQIGRDWSTICRFAQGKPQGDIPGVIADFADLAARHRLEKLCRTPVVRDFERVLSNCRSDGRMGCIVARNGRGKSATVRDWARRNPKAHATIIQCPSVCTRGDLVQLLCNALVLDTSDLKQPMRERALFARVTSRDMLIVDEAGYLVSERRRTSPLRLLQDLHDLCACPVVLVMRPGQWAQLMSGRTANDDEQLLGRILHRSVVKIAYKKDEIEPIVALYHGSPMSAKLRQSVKADLDREVGGLRALCRDLSLAADFARQGQVAFEDAFISATALRDAAPHLDKLDNF